MKMRKKILILILSITLIFLYHNRLDAYSLRVHERITEKVIKQNEEKLNQYLINIGLAHGIIEDLKSGDDKKKVVECKLQKYISLNRMECPGLPRSGLVLTIMVILRSSDWYNSSISNRRIKQNELNILLHALST